RDEAVAGARLAATALHIEGEPPRPVAARPGRRQLREELSDGCERAGVRRRIGARAPTDRRLVDLDHLVEHLPASERLVRARLLPPAAEAPRERRVERIDDETRLPGPRNARHARHRPERDVRVDATEIVRARASDADVPPRP